MNTFIIATRSLQSAEEEVEKILKHNKISQFDIDRIILEKALGIEDVRNIQKKIFLKPLKGDKKALIIDLSLGVSDEAQNSMLKLLEEPPPSSLIFLIAQNTGIFLPTVLSRAKIIEIKQESQATNDEGFERLQSITGIGGALKLAQEVSKEKLEAIAWLEGVILSAREEMLKNLENKQEALKFRKIIHKLELTHYDLKTTNANHRLALENLFLNLV